MAMAADEIERLIKESFPDAEVAHRGPCRRRRPLCRDASSRRRSAARPRVQQHQMVYEALKGQMGGTLHALALKTAAP